MPPIILFIMLFMVLTKLLTAPEIPSKIPDTKPDRPFQAVCIDSNTPETFSETLSITPLIVLYTVLKIVDTVAEMPEIMDDTLVIAFAIVL